MRFAPSILRFPRAALLSGRLFVIPVSAALAGLSDTSIAAPADLDRSFGGGTGKVTTSFGVSTNRAYSVAVQRDGKIVVVGDFWNAGNNRDFAIVRYNSDGSADPSFNGTGKVTTAIGTSDDLGKSVAVQNDAKIVVAGYAYFGETSSDRDFAVVRYNSNGTLDTTFGGTGKVTTDFDRNVDFGQSVIVQRDGKIVVAGFSGDDFALVRYKANGKLDTTFHGTGKVRTVIGSDIARGQSVAIQTDGMILVGGYCRNPGTGLDICLARYNTFGSLDTSFNGTGTVTTDIGTVIGGDDECQSVAIQNDGKIIGVGKSYNGSSFDIAVVRYKTNGKLDTTFGGTGKVTTGVGSLDAAGAQSVVVDSDGRIVVAAAGLGSFGPHGFALLRFNANGSLDTTFNGTGKVVTDFGFNGSEGAYSVALQGDGKIVSAGSAGSFFGVARYEGNPPAVDALIAKNPTDGFIGDDIFNRTGQNQAVTSQVERGSTKTFTVKVQNPTQTTASFIVQGTAKSAGFGVQYFDDIGADITADVVSGTYQITDLAPGAEALLSLGVTVKPRVPRDTVKTVKITVRPSVALDTIGTDAVKGRVTVR